MPDAIGIFRMNLMVIAGPDPAWSRLAHLQPPIPRSDLQIVAPAPPPLDGSHAYFSALAITAHGHAREATPVAAVALENTIRLPAGVTAEPGPIRLYTYQRGIAAVILQSKDQAALRKP